MSHDEQSSKVSRERLNQIAARKLQQLKVPVSPKPGTDLLEGELMFTPGRVLHPANQAPIGRGHFVVWGHDFLRFTEAPLAALEPIQFYDLEYVSVIEQRVMMALQKRLGMLRELETRCASMRLSPTLDAARLQLTVLIQSGGDAYELVADTASSLRVARVTLAHGAPQNASPQYPPLKLSEFPSGTDLELFLSSEVQKMLQAAPKAQARPVETLTVVPPPAGALTLATLQQRLGPDVFVVPGPKLEVAQELMVGTSRYRFQASHEGGTTFRGRLMGPSGEKWAERFELMRFPGVAALAATVLGVKAASAESAEPSGGGESAPSAASSHLAPTAGEVWVMNVIVEKEDGDEVRYVCTDIDGKPYGATRLLKKSEFQSVFVGLGNAWRLLIRIERVGGDQVSYRQLNAERQPLGPVKSMAVAILVTNFMPEAAAY